MSEGKALVHAAAVEWVRRAEAELLRARATLAALEGEGGTVRLSGPRVRGVVAAIRKVIQANPDIDRDSLVRLVSSEYAGVDPKALRRAILNNYSNILKGRVSATAPAIP